jgi:CelD/BcsL family acetyltransferase involved in cellulose biosynthesis
VNWSGGPPYECSLVWGADSLTALRAEWADLHGRAPSAYLSEGVDWAHVCWRTCAAPGSTRLLCLVVRRGLQLAAILPLIVSRRGLFRTAWPLACVTTEYCSLLTDPAADARGVWTAIEGGIRSLATVDAIVLPNVRDDAPLAAFLKGSPGVRETDSIPVRFLSRSAFDSWDSYCDQRPNGVKSIVNRGRRRLNRLGEVRFEDLTDLGARRAAWNWMVSHKRDWLVRKGLYHAFLPTEEYARFTEATLDISAPTGRRAIFALTVNGELVAAELANIDRQRVEAFVCSYDPAFSWYSPGNIMREEVVRWAYAHGLDYDWRLGGEAFKLDWASHTAMASTYVLARNRRGWLFGAYLAARTRLAYRTPTGLRAKIRSILRSPRRRGPPIGGGSDLGAESG